MARVELGVIWLFSLLTLVTQSDIMFLFSVLASSTVIVRNLPAACKVIKSVKRKI